MWPPGKPSSWGAAWFATFLCLLMIGGSLLHFLPVNPAFPAFFSFLPVVFWMIGREQRDAEKTISGLKARIDALEAIARTRGSAAGSGGSAALAAEL
jgi:hypothetical protein